MSELLEHLDARVGRGGTAGDLFQRLEDHPAYRQVANAIEKRIVARSLRAGDRLPTELDLARQFGVNRSTIREAIRELETHGLLARGRGEKRLRVTRPAPQSVSTGVSRALALHDVTFLELWEAMMAIEPAAAGYAAARRSPQQLSALTEASVKFSQTRGTNPAHIDMSDAVAAGSAAAGSAVAAVVDFFTAVAEASGNRVLALSQAPLNHLLAPVLTAIIGQVPQAHARIEEAQRRILKAIRGRRSEQARHWMEKHIRDFKRGYEL